jgi:O-antigen/teichoic acid export membrane protein
MLQILKKSKFARNVAVLAIGTALAQSLPIVASPLITRLYTPAEFGLYAVLTAIVSSLVSGAAGKYEIALILPKVEMHAKHILIISIFFLFVVSSLLAMILVIMHDWILKAFDVLELSGWIFLVPVILFLAGLVKILGHFVNRIGNYNLLVKAKLLHAFILVFFYICFGVMELGVVGLLFGSIVALFIAVVYLLLHCRSNFTTVLFLNFTKKIALAKRYKDYPLYNASTGLLNGVTAAAPSFFLISYYPEAVLGYYALMMRVYSSPLNILSASVSQINLKKVVDIRHKNQAITPYLLKLSCVLIAITIIPVVVLISYSEYLFAAIFGDVWRQAGVFAAILAPALSIRFVASTLSTTLGATNSNKVAALFNIVLFTSTLSLFVSMAPHVDVTELLKWYAVLIGALYGLLFLAIFHTASKNDKKTKIYATSVG